MMAKKMTINDKYAEVKAFLVENGATEDMVKFIDERAEMHAKKNGNRKPTKAQTENEGIKAEILNAMETNVAYTISSIQKMVGLDSNQKTSALVRQLKESGLVERSEVKGKAYFKKVG